MRSLESEGSQENSVCVIRDKGALKDCDYKRKLETERRNQEELAGIKGLPWEPLPGMNHVEVKLHLQYKEEEEVVRTPRSWE